MLKRERLMPPIMCIANLAFAVSMAAGGDIWLAEVNGAVGAWLLTTWLYD
jgi:hypothetical protein